MNFYPVRCESCGKVFFADFAGVSFREEYLDGRSLGCPYCLLDNLTEISVLFGPGDQIHFEDARGEVDK